MGAAVHNLVAVDPDITDNGQLVFELNADRVINAVDKNGKDVSEKRFKKTAKNKLKQCMFFYI